MVKLSLLALLLAACDPDLVDDTAIVRVPRVLAIAAEPAEAAPGTAVAVRALWADPDAPDAPIDWAFCTARKAFTESGTIASACFSADSPDVIALGAGATASGVLPAAGCRLFGPERPDTPPDEPAARPADPDSTGGYYQPLIATSDDIAVAQLRIRCGLPFATPAQAREYAATYVANTNPAFAIEAATSVASGASLDLVARWASCTDAPCDGAEPYVWFDPDARALVTRREAMRVAWFASSGSFSSARGGRDEADLATDVSTTWTAGGTNATIWAVLRDDRGGVAWQTLTITVE